MRLLNAITAKLEDFNYDRIPPYAILSHTWGQDEVSFQNIQRPLALLGCGYEKIKYCCDQALKDGYNYIWVDTCCIDKSSSAELSEAINSMFTRCEKAAVCYAYLSDVPSETSFSRDSHFGQCRWFTRGWTLQELIAPADVRFILETGRISEIEVEWHTALLIYLALASTYFRTQNHE
jgi:hypothetical protein